VNTKVDTIAADNRATVPATADRHARLPSYGGVVAAMVTPCKSPGVVDPAAMSHLARTLSAQGCSGLFVAASTGESALLDEDDRRALTIAARESVDSRTLIYAGVSGMGLKQTIRYANHAAADGADVAVIMAPLFFKVSQKELVNYLLAIAEASKIPIALYHHPRMATPLGVAAVAQVAMHANVVAIKDTSHSIERFRALVEATAGKPIALMQGNECLLLDSLQLGTAGMVTALAGVVPEWHIRLLEAVRTGDEPTANHWFGRIYELWKMFGFEQVSASISKFSLALKLALQRRGWLKELHCMLSGDSPDSSFEQIIQSHLVVSGVPAHEAKETRVDLPHSVNGMLPDLPLEIKGERNAVA
jgi:dihydrodipicolinate synthase/N-acetylneuraminate lyase